jgi:hypothetical protein
LLDIVSLFVAIIAIALAVVIAVRARAAEESAGEAKAAAERAVEAARAATAQAEAALEAAAGARGDGARALDLATRARADADGALKAAEANSVALTRSLETAHGSAGAKALTDESSGGALAASDAEVGWEASNVKGSVWVMTNTGTVTATAALLTDVTQPPKYVRPDEVIPRDVAPGDHLQFRAAFGKGDPPPRVRVVWREPNSGTMSSSESTLIEP